MTLETYINYFENLARASRDIGHNPEAGKHSFFVVENPFDNAPIDEALRNTLQLPALLLDVPDMDPSDNGSMNHTEQIDGTFAIVKEKVDESLVEIQNECLEIGKRFFSRMLKDYREKKIDPGKMVHFQLSDCQYSPIGPMAANFYGYLFTFRFVCPFQSAVTDDFWSDINNQFPYTFPYRLG